MGRGGGGQLDPPPEVTDYVHRVGRAARLGQKGRALLFLMPHERPFLQVLATKGIHLTCAPRARVCALRRLSLSCHGFIAEWGMPAPSSLSRALNRLCLARYGCTRGALLSLYKLVFVRLHCSLPLECAELAPSSVPWPGLHARRR
jgi:hypothetical protein